MRKALTILAVIGLIAPLAQAEMLVGRYLCARDNYNNEWTTSVTKNYGSNSNERWCKRFDMSTSYADWSEQDLEEIWQMIQTPPPAPYTAWDVRLGYTGSMGDPANPARVVCFAAFQSENDWIEGNGYVGDGTGASNDWAQCSDPTVCGAGSIDWQTGGAACNFWGLPEVINSVCFQGFTPSTGPADLDTMQCSVDLFLGGTLDVLCNDPLARGLRVGSAGSDRANEKVYHREQWGTAGPALLVYAVPEPASLLLLAIGGVGVLLRKKR